MSPSLHHSLDMIEFRGADLLTDIPDDLTIPQFFLDHHHPLRTVRPQGVPWLVDDVSGRAVAYEEVSIPKIPAGYS